MVAVAMAVTVAVMDAVMPMAVSGGARIPDVEVPPGLELQYSWQCSGNLHVECSAPPGFKPMLEMSC